MKSLEFKQVKSIYANPKVEKVTIFDTNDISKEETIDVSGIFVYVGQIPQTEFVKDLIDLDARGFIKVDNHFETSTKGVFAIGDCIIKDVRQIATAVGDAATAMHYIED